MKKLIGLLLGLGIVLTLVSACSGSQPVSYTPAAYGQNGVCYYVNTPAEVTALQAAGLCPRSWVAGPMPMSWLDMYYPYYDSGAYYNLYVPARLRATYIHTEHTYYVTHSSAIRSASSKAVYKSSSGGTVRGSTIIKSKSITGSGSAGTSFGSGKRSSTTTTNSGGNYGGGKRSSTISGTSGQRSSGFSGGSRSFGGGKR